MKFGFPDKSTVVKFDSTLFYRDYFNRLPNSKGVDFISVDKNILALIEVKNCTGDEANCRWRIAPDNTKKKYVILFLKGDFACRSRSKKTIMKSLQDSINKKLKWLNCQVSVVDSGTYDPKIFQIVS